MRKATLSYCLWPFVALCLASLTQLHAVPKRAKSLHSILLSFQNLALVPSSPFEDDKSCWSVLRPAASATCLETRTSSLGVRSSWCRLSDSSGVILIENLSPKAGQQDVYRVRMVGTTAQTAIELLPVSYCSRHLAVASYLLTHRGRYSVEILHLHSGYTLTDPSPVQDQGHIVAATFQTDFPELQPVAQETSTSPRCTQLDSPGKWVRVDPDAFSPHTCIREDYMTGCLPREASVDVGESGLTWWQPGCALSDLTTVQVGGCLRASKVCFMGDSHTRGLYNAFVDLMEGSFATRPPEGKDVRPSSTVAFYDDPWGHGSNEFFDDCKVIIRNTGAWHISWSMSAHGRAKPNLLDYLERVTQIAKYMVLAKDQGKQTIWMTSNGQPISLAVHKFKKFEHKDFRTDPLLLAINRLANDVMKDHNISIFDTWSMTNPVADISYDGIHFGGDVLYYTAMRLLNSICYNPENSMHW